MSLFKERLEAFPRIEPYRFAKAEHLWPYYKMVESAATPKFTIEGREVTNFGSNNYLSLSYHPDVIAAAQAATAKYGTGVTGSRLLNGTLPLHRDLETELADFYGTEAALVFSTGYVANLCGISGFLGRSDYAVVDKEAHNSLVTAIRLSGAQLKRFRHNDADQLAAILADLPEAAAKGVIVDGVYSMRGDTAPLTEIVEAVRTTPNAFVFDDEAHGLGVLGERGRGAGELYGLLDLIDITTITFSKALGSCGGAVLGSAEAIELLTITAEPFIFTASNVPASMAAALAALRILRAEPDRPGRLRANVEHLIGALTDRGIRTNPAESAIVTIPLKHHDDLSTVFTFRDLFELGVFCNPVIPPASHGNSGLLRLSLMADHDADLLDDAADVICKVLTDGDQLVDAEAG
ncbi:MAG: aminotransferase class I/II-fold pyridoxal phosphate-dependent enzyme [Acidimicrobiia bacterium]|jgi:8-amino-7-oxononanoate synthase